MDKLCCKKYAAVVQNPPKNIKLSITFQQIRQKLENNVYISVVDWGIDMNDLIYDIIDGVDNKSTDFLVMKEILRWLENKIYHHPKSQEDVIRHELNKIIAMLREFVRIISIRSTRRATDEKQASFTEDDLIELQAKLDEITDPKLLIQLFFILRKHIDHAEIQPTTILTDKMLNQECYDELRQFLIRI